MNPKFKYILGYFKTIYDVPDNISIGYGTTDQKINIHKSNTNYFDSLQPYSIENVKWRKWHNTTIPFLFDPSDEKEILEIREEQAFVRYDILASAFFFLSGWQEFVFMKQKKAWRYPFVESIQNKLNITHLPIVNYYFDILKTAIEKTYNIQLQITNWENNEFGICLTHDIDQCETGWQEDAFAQFKKLHLLSILKIFYQRIFKQDTWFNFNEILNIEKKFSAHSSFYFLSKNGKIYLDINKLNAERNENDKKYKSYKKHSFFARYFGYPEVYENADYSIQQNKFRKVFQEIQDRGSEIGVHGSITSHLSEDMIRQEIDDLSTHIYGIRFHYLFFDRSRTFDILEKSGLKYDTTMGFSEEVGFRYGIAFPFVPYNISDNKPYSFMEIPLIIMEMTYRVYKNTPVDQILPDIISLMDEVQKFNGCLTILWHNSYFSPYKYAGWREIYESILREGRNRKAGLFSGLQVGNQWSNILT